MKSRITKQMKETFIKRNRKLATKAFEDVDFDAIKKLVGKARTDLQYSPNTGSSDIELSLENTYELVCC